MPTGATMNTTGGTAQTTSGKGQSQAPAIVKPFVRASLEHRESAGLDVTRAITASDQDLGSLPIPAYGYIRSLLLVVTVSGGAGTAVFSPDAPFNFLKNIVIQEPNGATIAQFNSGYDLFVANKYGGYRANNDPRSHPSFATNVAGGSATFILRIPLELRLRDALGALPNQNSAAAFQFRATIAASTQAYTTPPPTTLPNIRVRAYAEEWDQPSVSSDGTANATTPPAMNTTQYWSSQVFPIVSGQNMIRLTRVGNYIRNLGFIYRDNAGARILNSTNAWPDQAQLFYDTRPIDTIQQDIWRGQVWERYGYGGQGRANNAFAGLDDGVYPYDFCHEFDGQVGMELNDGWLPTLSSTRLELQGQFATAGTLTVLTNDVSVAGNVFIG